MIHANDIKHLWDKSYLTATEFDQLLNFVLPNTTIILSQTPRVLLTAIPRNIYISAKHKVTVGSQVWSIGKGVYERYKNDNNPITTAQALRRADKISNVLA